MIPDDLRTYPRQRQLTDSAGDQPVSQLLTTFFEEASKCDTRSDERGEDVYNFRLFRGILPQLSQDLYENEILTEVRQG